MKKDTEETKVEETTKDAPTTDTPKTEADAGAGGFGGVSPYGR